MSTLQEREILLQEKLNEKDDGVGIYTGYQQLLGVFKDKTIAHIHIQEKEINKLINKIKEHDERISRDMGNIDRKIEIDENLDNENLKMNKKIENIESTVNRKKNMIYILFIINLILAVVIVLGIFFKIKNKNLDISKTFKTKIKN